MCQNSENRPLTDPGSRLDSDADREERFRMIDRFENWMKASGDSFGLNDAYYREVRTLGTGTPGATFGILREHRGTQMVIVGSAGLPFRSREAALLWAFQDHRYKLEPGLQGGAIPYTEREEV